MLRAVVMQQSVSHVIFCPSLASSWAHCMQFSASPLNRLKTPFHCCVCVCQSLSCIQLCATLGTVVCQASLSLEFSSQEYWSGQPFPSPWDLPNPGDEPGSPALQANSLPFEAPGEPYSQQRYAKVYSYSGCSHVLVQAWSQFQPTLVLVIGGKLLGRKAMTNLDSGLKSKCIAKPIQCCKVKNKTKQNKNKNI